LIGKPLQTVIVRHNVSQLGKGVFMTIHHKTPGLASMAALALGALLAVPPVPASALTLLISEQGGTGTIRVEDGDDGTVDGVITESNINIGGASILVASAASFDGSRVSELFLNVTRATTGSRNLFIDVLHTGFGGGAGSPQASSLTFTSNASRLSSGGSVVGAGFTDDQDRSGVLANIVGSGAAITSTSNGINEAETQILTDPFSMTLLTEISRNTTAAYDATLTATAPIPLPASALMLLGGLGGLGGLSALRRRKRAA
jgi:hypothetical protein